jgi:hypothetical protein
MARSSYRWLASVVAVLFAGSIAAACGGSGQSGSTGGGGSTSSTGGTGGTGGIGGNTGSGGDGAGIPIGCDPACVDPQFCSAAYVCIDEGTCLEDSDCTRGTICDKPNKTCIPGGMCGGKEAKADPIAPNLLIVLDRSCSMTAKINGVTKWEIAVKAINTMTTSFAGKIRFGLTLFPDLTGGNCKQDAIPIPVTPGNEMAIQELLNAALMANDPYFPDGPCVTNIDSAMEQATTEPAFADTDRGSYALLLTDGQQSSNCATAGGDAGTEMIIKDLHDTKMVPSFVLAFGDEQELDPVELDKFATLGGVPSAGVHKYYDAADQMSLDAALKAIADKTLGCTFSLDETPPNADEIFVFLDNLTVARDATHMKGWDYDPANNQVTFYGEECSKLKAGSITDVDIVFGCDEPTPD